MNFLIKRETSQAITERLGTYQIRITWLIKGFRYRSFDYKNKKSLDYQGFRSLNYGDLNRVRTCDPYPVKTSHAYG